MYAIKLSKFIFYIYIIFFNAFSGVYAGDDDSGYGGKKTLLRLIEIGAVNTNASSRSPETVGSLLSNMRLANSLTSNSSEFFREINRSNEAASSGRFKFSHKLGELFFVGIAYADSAKINYDRTSLGTQGTYIHDNVQSSLRQRRINAGIGPMNYLSDFSFELSLGYEAGVQGGPFANYGIKFPRISGGSLTPGSIFAGTGNMKFDYKAYSMTSGVSGVWGWFGMYYLMDLQYFFGSLELNSYGYDTKDFSGKVKSPFTLSPNLQYASLKYSHMYGILLNQEAGFIIRFMEELGLKIGGYWQIAAALQNKPKGYYFSNNELNEATSSLQLTSPAHRKNIGFYGVTFSVITRF